MITGELFDKFPRSNVSLSRESNVEVGRRSTTKPVLTSSTAIQNSNNISRQAKFTTQNNFNSIRTSTSSLNQRQSSSNDFFSVLRSFARRPFRGPSMSDTLPGESPISVDRDTNFSSNSSVNLLRIRPLSNVEIDQNPFRQSNEAVAEFLRQIGSTSSKNLDETSGEWKTAEKFLHATNFSVQRSVELFKNHREMRQNENLDRISMKNEDLIREIQSNKVFVLNQQAHQPVWIIYVVPCLHCSSTVDSANRELIVLQSFFCQIDFITESFDVQKNGVNLIYDMKSINPTTAELNFSKKLLKNLQSSYPVALKSVYLLSAPKNFKSLEKVKLISNERMTEFLLNEFGYSADLLPENLGGQISFSSINNVEHFERCRNRVTNENSSCSNFYLVESQTSTSKHLSNVVFSRKEKEKSSFLTKTKEISKNWENEDFSSNSKMGEAKRMAIRSPFKPLNENEFLSKGENEIRREFSKLPDPPAKDPFAAREPKNVEKSRYRDVVPGEPTRVKLQPDQDDSSDFINANYVTGYNNQEKFYIFTQGPLPSTVRDFWRMIWQEKISVIVMTTNLRESGMNKCFQYWPSENDGQMTTGSYQIKFVKSEKFESFLITILTLTKLDEEKSRTVFHSHFLKWPDHGVPSTTKDALFFLDKVDEQRNLAEEKAPILLHCSAGIGRTGTFCAIDIGIKRFLDTKTIDVPSTVVKMRNERSGSVQTEDQYFFVYSALSEFIRQNQQKSTNNDEQKRKTRHQNEFIDFTKIQN